ncbi:3989_t:CDS:2 [Cetraspora pellucida]|uniref:3989_t:CDS:1 n=1 Tax=Cetraspora pellucida TaxID=1433469 RepID=A0ACA9LDD9_9GLOM|nr:3989_t:CDS:2 [Cetraspora pellucida]
MTSAINVSALKFKTEAKENKISYTESTCAITDKPINEVIIKNDQDDISYEPICNTDNINHKPIYDTDSSVEKLDSFHIWNDIETFLHVYELEKGFVFKKEELKLK